MRLQRRKAMKKPHIIMGIMGSLFLLTEAIPVHSYNVGEVHHAGTLHGQVTFSGTPPAPVRFTVEKNPEVCGEERSLLKVDTHNGLIAGVVVILEGVQTGKPFPTQTFPGQLPGEGKFRYEGGKSLGLQVKTKECNFGPFTGVISADEAVRFQNQDINQACPPFLCVQGYQGENPAHSS
jgi:hypothetical protein